MDHTFQIYYINNVLAYKCNIAEFLTQMHKLHVSMHCDGTCNPLMYKFLQQMFTYI